MARVVIEYRFVISLALAAIAGTVGLHAWPFPEQHPLLGLIALNRPTVFAGFSYAYATVYRVAGADVECLDHPERHAIARRFEQALRQLDESCRLYEYVIKRPAAPITSVNHGRKTVQDALQRRVSYLASKTDALYEFDLYFVVLYECPALQRSGWAT